MVDKTKCKTIQKDGWKRKEFIKEAEKLKSYKSDCT